jgi:hypothetical protein
LGIVDIKRMLVTVSALPPIDVNTATKAELITIEGITPNIADHIIKDRPYRTVEDVQGVVPRFLFEKIRARITVASNPRIATPTTSQPPRGGIQVIQGNMIQNLKFERKRDDAPVDKNTSPASDPKTPQ